MSYHACGWPESLGFERFIRNWIWLAFLNAMTHEPTMAQTPTSGYREASAFYCRASFKGLFCRQHRTELGVPGSD
jgi:hypothetical protein